jgi:hypothetical protein
VGNENVAENVLCLIISGYAAGDTAEKIVREITSQLLPLGYTWDWKLLSLRPSMSILQKQ